MDRSKGSTRQIPYRRVSPSLKTHTHRYTLLTIVLHKLVSCTFITLFLPCLQLYPSVFTVSTPAQHAPHASHPSRSALQHPDGFTNPKPSITSLAYPFFSPTRSCYLQNSCPRTFRICTALTPGCRDRAEADTPRGTVKFPSDTPIYISKSLTCEPASRSNHKP